jgi:hypothetical protein
MAGEVTLVAPSMPTTAYFVVRNSSGQYWYTVTPAFEAYNAAHWTDYDVALTQDGASQNYTGTFPSAITTGVYQLSAYAQSGGSPAVGDVLIGTDGRFEWSGTAIVSLDSRVKPADTLARVTLTDTVTTVATGGITAASIADGAIDAATFAADVDTEIRSYIIDDDTRVDASALNTATVTTIPAILVDTAEIGVAGAGLTEAGGTGDQLTAVPWNAAWDAEVQSECADALTAFGASTLTAAQVNAECDTAIADAALATAANLATVLADTNELQTDWTNGGRLDLILDGILDDTGTTGVVLATSAIGSNQLTTGAKTDLADAFLNRVMPGSITEDSTAYYLKYGPYVAFVSNVTGTPSSTVVQVTGTGVTTDDYWNDCLLVIQDADGKRQAKPILTYNYDAGGPTYTFTVDEAFASVPVSGNVAFVVLTHIHPVSQIQSGLATSAGLATAQLDLDILTGTDGVTLATSQPNYAPSTAASLATLAGKFTGITLLAQWLGAAFGKQTPNSTALTEINATGAGSGTFTGATDSLEALRDRGDSAWVTATGFSTFNPTTDTVTLGDTAHGGSSATLELAAVQVNGDTEIGGTLKLIGGFNLGTKPAATYADGTNSFLGVLKSDGSALATQSSVDDLPTNSELATALGAADDAILTVLGTPAGASVSADIAAVNAKTTNLPGSPAAVGSQMTLADGAITDAKFTVPALTGPASGPVGQLVQLWRRFFKKATKTSTEIVTYADNGTTVISTQAISDDGTTETQGAAT